MDNSPLRISLNLTKGLRFIIYFAGLLLLVQLGALIFSQEIPEWVRLSLPDFELTYGESLETTRNEANKAVLIASHIKSLIVLLLLASLFELIIKVLKSLKSLETFKNENVRAFRKMGVLFTLMFFVNIPSLEMVNGVQRVSISFEPLILLGTLICYLLAEIFREGNRLMEENKLTI